MNKSIKLKTIALLMATAGSSGFVQAEENAGSTLIQVTGSVTPSNTCTYNGINGDAGTLDFGSWLVSGLPASGGSLKNTSVTITVDCGTATPLFMRFASTMSTNPADTGKMGYFAAGSTNKEMIYVTLTADGNPESGSTTGNLSAARWAYNGNVALSSITAATTDTPVANPVVNAIPNDEKNGLIVLKSGSTQVESEKAYKFTFKAEAFGTQVSGWKSDVTAKQNLSGTMTITLYTL